MTTQDIIDNIDGSVKKKQYLEAFLLQSTYLEGIVKSYASANFSVFFTSKVDIASSSEKQKSHTEKIRKYIENEVDGYNFGKTIAFLSQTETVEKTIIEGLNKYKTTRNKVIHRLITQVSGTDFENELKNACSLGKDLLENNHFQIIIKAIVKYESQPS